jgi:kynureninase
VITRDDCVLLDDHDAIGHLRAEFILAEGEIYLDGNSLGPVCHEAQRRVREVIDTEWATGLVRSWNAAHWMDLPLTVGEKIARLIGAETNTVVAADTLTFMLAKMIGGALDLRPDRHVIITDAANFHSDIYIANAIAQRHARPIEVRAIDRTTLDEHLGDDVALVMLTQVDFRTGEQLDLEDITERVHAAGALMLWDFAHSTGAVPLNVTSANIDFAAGCGYKYLNGGPGAPAFGYIAPRWQNVVENPLPGWLGHARPFDFELNYEAAAGMRSFITSSPSILALAALDGALNVFEQTTMSALRRKSLELTDLFIELVESLLPGQFEVVTPREHTRRGSQVALRHPEAYGIVQAMISRGVTGDFRDPDIARFGFAPLYVRFVDVYDAVQHLVAVMDAGEHRDARFAVRNPVT